MSNYPKFANFGEYLFYAYANVQMLFFAVKSCIPKYNRLCYMIRAKAFRAYKEGRWNIHDLFEFNIEKIRNNNYCWYCGQELEPSKLTKDHVFPRSKGGANEMDNIIMVCKSCNSSKGNMDLFEWYATLRHVWPPINVLVHYLKNIYLYSVENGLINKQQLIAELKTYKLVDQYLFHTEEALKALTSIEAKEREDMNLEINQSNLYLLLPSKVAGMAEWLSEDKNVSIVEAIKMIYSSDMFKRLEDESTKMWHLGPVALYQELTGDIQ